VQDAMAGYDKKNAAEDAAWLWDHTVGFAVEFISKPMAGIPARVVEGSVEIWLGVDGKWTNDVDRGGTFTEDDAEDAAIRAMAPDGPDETLAVINHARESYAGTSSVVGHPEPPTSEERDPWAPLRDGVREVIEERRHR
jgi:hypothetical protein